MGCPPDSGETDLPAGDQQVSENQALFLDMNLMRFQMHGSARSAKTGKIRPTWLFEPGCLAEISLYSFNEIRGICLPLVKAGYLL